jgi:hypothetical protein
MMQLVPSQLTVPLVTVGQTVQLFPQEVKEVLALITQVLPQAW